MGLLDATSTVAQGLAQLAARASEVLPNAAPNAPLDIDTAEKTKTITHRLVDLRIPDSLKEWIVPPLGSLGFSIIPVEVQGNFGTPTRSYDVIRNAAGQRSLFHFPKEILEDGASWESVSNVIAVMRLRNQALVILSEGLQSAHVAYSAVAEPLWLTDFKVTATFVPWPHLTEIKPMAMNDQLVFLPKILRLEDLLAAAQALPTTGSKLSDAERATLADILGRLATFTDQGDKAWRLLLQQAGLGELIPGLDLAGTANDVAFRLVSNLRYYAPLPAYPNDHVLGLMLCQVLTMGDLKPADCDQIKLIIKKYNLAPSRQ
jgi:hypothetical protein